MFCHAVQGALGLDKGKTWEDVRRDLSDNQVKKIYEAFGSLWPSDTEIANLLPQPDPIISRGLYLGTVDPRTISANAIGLLTYFDEIILPNPFINPSYIKPEFSPTHSPAQHKEQTLKNIVLLLTLEPFIHAGMIHLIPDPMDFNEEFRRDVWSIAEERTKNWKPSEEDLRQSKSLFEDDFKRSFRRLPEQSQLRQIRKFDPDMKDEKIEQVITLMQEQHKQDPLALLQSMEPGQNNAQVNITKGFNLESALFLAGMTGAFIYTDMQVHWGHLHEHTRAASKAQTNASWMPVIDNIKAIALPLQHDANKVMESRLSGGPLGSVRNLITRLLCSMLENNNPARLNPMITQLDNAIKRIQQKEQEQSSGTVLEMQFEFSVSTAGFENHAIRRLIVTFGRTNNIRIAPIAMLLHIYQVATE
jgi:hypothetical protein